MSGIENMPLNEAVEEIRNSAGFIDIKNTKDENISEITTKTAVMLAEYELTRVVNEMAKPIILAEGTVDILSSADVGTGGVLVSARIEYIAIDSGATIVST